jgi:small subunit ribosomal protein S4
MGRYTGPVCKICRREGLKLFLKGDRCFTPKCAVERRPYPPGQHQQRRRKMSDYGLQLREKQKLKFIYGILERQFRRHFEEAARRPGPTGENLLTILESRLDNVVYRMGFADSRRQARQLVRHGHFEVNGRKVDIPSYQVEPGTVIAVRERSRNLEHFQVAMQELSRKQIPSWVSVDPTTMTGRVLRLPSRDEIDTTINEQLIVEFYSR